MKRCSRCKIEKPVSSFRVSDKKTRRRSNDCAVCHNKRMKEYGRKKYATVEGRAKVLFTNAKSRSKKKGLVFDLSLPLVVAKVKTGRCELSGLPFDNSPPTTSKSNMCSASLDRRDPKGGYVDCNIGMICNALNMGKADHDEIDFIAMCVAVAERHADDPRVIERLKELRNAES